MSKIEEAVSILKTLGLPVAQQNERSALTLLALLDLEKDTSWHESKKRTIRIHDIIVFIQENYATLKDCTARRIYVSVFPDFREFKRHIDNIAWETEVWIENNPDHMIILLLKRIIDNGGKKWLIH